MTITNAQYIELFTHLRDRTHVIRETDDSREITASVVEWLIDDECLRFAHIDEIARDLTQRDLECLACDLRDLWHGARAAAYQDRLEYGYVDDPCVDDLVYMG